MSYSAIACQEVEGTRKESGSSGDAPSAFVTVMCNYADRWALVADIGNNLRTWPHGGMCALLPLKSFDIRIAPGEWGTSGQTILYPQAYIDLTYGVGNGAEEKNSAGEVFSESLEGTVEVLKQDFKRFVWINDAGQETGEVLESEAPSIPVYGQILRRTLQGITVIPPAVESCLGKCNSTGYYSNLLGRNFAAETLLFKPSKQRRTIKSDGTSLGWTVDLEFVYNPEGWNRFWKATDQAYRKFAVKRWTGSTYALDPYKPIPTADFSGFFA